METGSPQATSDLWVSSLRPGADYRDARQVLVLFRQDRRQARVGCSTSRRRRRFGAMAFVPGSPAPVARRPCQLYCDHCAPCNSSLMSPSSARSPKESPHCGLSQCLSRADRHYRHQASRLLQQRRWLRAARLGWVARSGEGAWMRCSGNFLNEEGR